MPTYYEILNVSPDASTEEIKAVYRNLIKQHHPDVNPDNEGAMENTQLLNEAYSFLIDSQKRREYDRALALQKNHQQKEDIIINGKHKTNAEFKQDENISFYNSFKQKILRIPLVSNALVLLTKNNHKKYYKTFSVQENKTHFYQPDKLNQELIDFGTTMGIDLDDFEKSIENCNHIVKSIAFYVKSNTPMTEVTKKGNQTIYRYELDRTKLDGIVIHQHAVSIQSEIFKIVSMPLVNLLKRNTISKEDYYKKLLIQKYVKQRVNFLLGTFFNIAILKSSVVFIKEISTGSVSEQTLKGVRKIVEQPILKGWLQRSPVRKRYIRLLKLLADFENNQKHMLELKKELDSLWKVTDMAKTITNDLEKLLNYFESSNMEEEYNSFTPQYTSLMNKYEKRVRKYNDLMNHYNTYIHSLDIEKIEKAFNDCLDPALFFAEFDIVNLQQNTDSKKLFSQIKDQVRMIFKNHSLINY